MDNNNHGPKSPVKDAELVAKMSLEQIIKGMTEQALSVLECTSGDFHQKIISILNANEEEQRELARQTKVRALWLLFSQSGIVAAKSQINNVQARCAEQFMNQKVSALDIIEVANICAYEMHTYLLRDGETFSALQKKYDCDESISAMLYQLALEKTKTLPDFLIKIATSLESQQGIAAEEIISQAMELFGEYYQALHIVETYPKHIPSLDEHI